MTEQEPWKITPTELIKQAIDLLNQDTETSLRIAYLLFDVAIENLFKTYLLLSDSITGVNMKYSDRKKGAEGNFNTLIETMKELRLDQVSNKDLDKIKYYHDIRNKLYHQGDGVIPTKKNTQDYASLTTNLLFHLLQVDLRSNLVKENINRQLLAKRESQIENEFAPIKRDLEKIVNKVAVYINLFLEELDYEFAEKEFINEMEEFLRRMSADDVMSWKSGVRRLINEGLFVLDENDIPIGCYEWGKYGYDAYEFLIDFIEESMPVEPYPKELIEYLELYDLGYSETMIAEIITSDDITEVLLIIANHLEDFPKIISINDYQEARTIVTWQWKEYIHNNRFEEQLSEIVKKGNQLVSKINDDLGNLPIIV